MEKVIVTHVARSISSCRQGRSVMNVAKHVGRSIAVDKGAMWKRAQYGKGYCNTCCTEYFIV